MLQSPKDDFLSFVSFVCRDKKINGTHHRSGKNKEQRPIGQKFHLRAFTRRSSFEHFAMISEQMKDNSKSMHKERQTVQLNFGCMIPLEHLVCPSFASTWCKKFGLQLHWISQLQPSSIRVTVLHVNASFHDNWEAFLNRSVNRLSIPKCGNTKLLQVHSV